MSLSGKDTAQKYFSTELPWVLPAFPTGREDSVNFPESKKHHWHPSGWSSFVKDPNYKGERSARFKILALQLSSCVVLGMLPKLFEFLFLWWKLKSPQCSIIMVIKSDNVCHAPGTGKMLTKTSVCFLQMFSWRLFPLTLPSAHSHFPHSFLSHPGGLKTEWS